MPRVVDGNSDPYDYCKPHFPKTEAEARKIHGKGEGPDNRGNCFAYDCDHPPYDGEDYQCHTCRIVLTAADD